VFGNASDLSIIESLAFEIFHMSTSRLHQTHSVRLLYINWMALPPHLGELCQSNNSVFWVSFTMLDFGITDRTAQTIVD
jgi:hypothetical protein